MAQFTDDKKVLIIRKALGVNQSQLAQKLKVSTALINAVEKRGHKLSDQLKNKLVEKLGVNRDWLNNVVVDCFSKQTINAEKLNEAAAKALESLAQPPIAPLSTTGIAIGIGTAEVVQRLCQAYSAKNLKDLATNHLQISPATITGWIKRNKIPEEQIVKVIKEGIITPEQLLSNDEYVLVKKYDLVDIIREMYVGDHSTSPRSTNEIKTELERLLKEYQKPIKKDEED